MVNELRKWVMYTLVSIGLNIAYTVQTTQNHKIAIILFAFLLLCIAVFCVTENKKLSLRSIEFFKSLAFGSGIFFLVVFWTISHNKYEYFLLIVLVITNFTIIDPFDNEIKNNLK